MGGACAWAVLVVTGAWLAVLVFTTGRLTASTTGTPAFLRRTRSDARQLHAMQEEVRRLTRRLAQASGGTQDADGCACTPAPPPPKTLAVVVPILQGSAAEQSLPFLVSHFAAFVEAHPELAFAGVFVVEQRAERGERFRYGLAANLGYLLASASAYLSCGRTVLWWAQPFPVLWSPGSSERGVRWRT